MRLKKAVESARNAETREARRMERETVCNDTNA